MPSLEYIAAFVDCDGTIGISKANPKRPTPQYYARMALYSQNLAVLTDIQQVIGGFLVVAVTGKSGVYRLDLPPQKTLAALKDLLPHLRIKREQAELAIRLHEGITKLGPRPGRKRLTPEMVAEREALYLRMKELNHKDSTAYRRNWVNSGEARKRRVILIQAAAGQGAAEGATTRRVSPNNNPAHECPATRDGGRYSLSNTDSPDLHNAVLKCG